MTKEEALKQLREKGFKGGLEDKDGNGYTPLFMAAYHGNEAMVELLLRAGARKNFKAKDGATALLVSAQNGHFGCVEALIRAEANVDAAKNDGATALLVSAQNGHFGCVEALIRAEANVDAAKNTGRTPLMIAVLFNHPNVVKCLVEEGADIDAKDNGGMTALDWAREEKHDEVAALLRDAPALKAAAAKKKVVATGGAPAQGAAAAKSKGPTGGGLWSGLSALWSGGASAAATPANPPAAGAGGSANPHAGGEGASGTKTLASSNFKAKYRGAAGAFKRQHELFKTLEDFIGGYCDKEGLSKALADDFFERLEREILRYGKDGESHLLSKSPRLRRCCGRLHRNSAGAVCCETGSLASSSTRPSGPTTAT